MNIGLIIVLIRVNLNIINLGRIKSAKDMKLMAKINFINYDAIMDIGNTNHRQKASGLYREKRINHPEKYKVPYSWWTPK